MNLAHLLSLQFAPFSLLSCFTIFYLLLFLLFFIVPFMSLFLPTALSSFFASFVHFYPVLQRIRSLELETRARLISHLMFVWNSRAFRAWKSKVGWFLGFDRRSNHTRNNGALQLLRLTSRPELIECKICRAKTIFYSIWSIPI